MVPAALFLAAKVEEQPHKLEHVIKVAHACLHPQEPPLDTKSEVSVESGELGSDRRSRNGRNCRIPARTAAAAPSLGFRSPCS